MSRFRILSLPGGGARGLFQAEFLTLLEIEADRPLSQVFDLIAGTSTGAIVGLPIASGIAASTVAQQFKSAVSDVFTPPGNLARLRRGPLYDSELLRKSLEGILGNKGIRELATDVCITTAVADRYEPKILTRESPGTIVEAALASGAAPTYFPPHQFAGSDQGAYLDGGLWANDPTSVAVLHAINEMDVDPSDIDVLVLGNGTHVAGRHNDELYRLRQISRTSFLVFLNGTMALQAAQSQKTVAGMGVSSLRIDPNLQKPIALDDAEESIRVLSPLVKIEFDNHRQQLVERFISEPDPPIEDEREVPQATLAGIRAANISTFIPDRSFYKIARGDQDDISNYVSRARSELTMVSINLMTGHVFELLLQTFRQMVVDRESSVKIRLSLLNPENENVMGAIAPVLNKSGEGLADEIRELMRQASAFHKQLPLTRATNFSMFAHDAIPPASAILIDPNSAEGTIQLETKTYKTTPDDSFGFEVSRPSDFYDTLHTSYQQLIEDGSQIF